MKFTDLDATGVKSETIRVDLDGYSLTMSGQSISLDGQWIDVLPTESDEFQDAKLALQRKAIMGEPSEGGNLLSTIIAGWSFDEPCNKENKIKAIKIWPKILIDQIDMVASKAVNFTKTKPKRLPRTRKK